MVLANPTSLAWKRCKNRVFSRVELLTWCRQYLYGGEIVIRVELRGADNILMVVKNRHQGRVTYVVQTISLWWWNRHQGRVTWCRQYPYGGEIVIIVIAHKQVGVHKQVEWVGQKRIYIYMYTLRISIWYLLQGSHQIYGHIRRIWTVLADPSRDECLHDGLVGAHVWNGSIDWVASYTIYKYIIPCEAHVIYTQHINT